MNYDFGGLFTALNAAQKIQKAMAPALAASRAVAMVNPWSDPVGLLSMQQAILKGTGVLHNSDLRKAFSAAQIASLSIANVLESVLPKYHIPSSVFDTQYGSTTSAWQVCKLNSRTRWMAAQQTKVLQLGGLEETRTEKKESYPTGGTYQPGLCMEQNTYR